MGVFAAFCLCRGDAGFSSPLLGVCSGVVGFNVDMLSRLVREKVRPVGQRHRACAKIFALHAQNTPKSAFFRLLGELFRGRATGGAVLGEFFAPIGPEPRSCRRRGARGWLRWGFCSIRSWLAACRRRVGVLMMQFPPWGDAGQVLEPGCMLCAQQFRT